MVLEPEGVDGLSDRGFGPNETELGLVGAGCAVGGVVGLEDDVGAGFEQRGLTGAEGVGHGAGGKSGDVGGGAALVPALRGDEGFVEGVFGEPLGAGFADEGEDVVDEGAIARAGFGELDPLIFGEAGGDDGVYVLDGAGGGDVEGFGDFEDEVRVRDAPAGGECGVGFGVFGVAFGGALLGPSGEGGDLFDGEGRVVRELADMGISEPGGHAFHGGGFPNGFGEGSGLLVGEEGHRGGFAGAMATLAFGLEDGEDVFMICNGRWVGGEERGGAEEK